MDNTGREGGCTGRRGKGGSCVLQGEEGGEVVDNTRRDVDNTDVIGFATHCHSSGHHVHTQHCTVSPHDSKIHSIEDEDDAELHHVLGVDGQQQTQPTEHEQQDDIAHNTKHIGGLVDEQKPAIH